MVYRVHYETHPLDFDGRYSIDGELTVDEFNREVDADLKEQHAHTVAGLVLNAYGELPPVGSTVEIRGMRFIVDAVEHNRIRQLTVEMEKRPEPEIADPVPPEGVADQTLPESPSLPESSEQTTVFVIFYPLQLGCGRQ